MLTSAEFVQGTADECIYIMNNNDAIKIIFIYVDDLGLFASSKAGMTWIKGGAQWLFCHDRSQGDEENT